MGEAEARRDRGGVSSGRLNRRNRLLFAGGLVVLAVVVAAAIALDSGSSDDSPAVAEGESPGDANAFDAELEFFDGTQGRLSDFRGQPVVVNFFASWCPPCAAEMPDFEAVHAARGAEVAFVGLAMQDTREAAARLVEQTGVTYAIADDSEGALFRRFSAVSMPTTVFLDPDGVVVDRHGGILDQGGLNDRIDRILEEAS